MDPGNASSGVVDLLVMRIYQRTGANTGISFRVGTILFVLLALGGLISEAGAAIVASPSLMIGFGILVAAGVGIWALVRHATKDEREERREYEHLLQLEQAERERKADAARKANLERLRSKYRA